MLTSWVRCDDGVCHEKNLAITDNSIYLFVYLFFYLKTMLENLESWVFQITLPLYYSAKLRVCCLGVISLNVFAALTFGYSHL